MAHAGGRPSKLTEDLLAKAQHYYQKKLDAKEIPWVEELAVYELDVARQTISYWCERAQDAEWMKKQDSKKRAIFTQFYDTIEKIASLQLMHLKKLGLAHGKNVVAIFLMKANHGMIETSRLEHSGPDGEPVKFAPIQVMQIKERRGH